MYISTSIARSYVCMQDGLAFLGLSQSSVPLLTVYTCFPYPPFSLSSLPDTLQFNLCANVVLDK